MHEFSFSFFSFSDIYKSIYFFSYVLHSNEFCLLALTAALEGIMHITYLSDNRKHPWLSIVVSVGTDPQINLPLAGVSAEGSHKTEQGVLWGLRDEVVGEELCLLRHIDMVREGAQP